MKPNLSTQLDFFTEQRQRQDFDKTELRLSQDWAETQLRLSRDSPELTCFHWADDKQSKAQNLDSKYRQMALVGFDT